MASELYLFYMYCLSCHQTCNHGSVRIDCFRLSSVIVTAATQMLADLAFQPGSQATVYTDFCSHCHLSFLSPSSAIICNQKLHVGSSCTSQAAGLGGTNFRHLPSHLLAESGGLKHSQAATHVPTHPPHITSSAVLAGRQSWAAGASHECLPEFWLLGNVMPKQPSTQVYKVVRSLEAYMTWRHHDGATWFPHHNQVGKTRAVYGQIPTAGSFFLAVQGHPVDQWWPFRSFWLLHPPPPQPAAAHHQPRQLMHHSDCLHVG